MSETETEYFARTEIELARQILKIQVAAAQCEARSHAIADGETDETLAARLVWTVERWHDAMLNPNKLDTISDFMWACGFLINFELRSSGRRVGPGAAKPETATLEPEN